MRRLRCHNGQRPYVLPQLRFQALKYPFGWLWALVLGILLSWPGAAVAAEVFQVRSATLLQIGDGNRNYGVELACVGVDADDQLAATAWLRQQLPRRTRVNLRPLAEQGGLLLAQVSRLDREGDIGSALIAAGLAHLDPSPSAAACSGPEPS